MPARAAAALPLDMLQLRAEMEGGRAPEAPARYFELSYYERALARLSR